MAIFGIKKGIKVAIGLPSPQDGERDELILVANRILSNLSLVEVPVDTVARFIGMAAEAEGIKLEYHQKAKEFRREG